MNDGSHFACNDRRVARVLRYLVDDLSRRPTLADVSKVAGLEANYFSKRFRATVGVSYARWNTQMRVSHASELLEIADLSITAIAAAVGYMDVTTFERAFRRTVGTCPREYRRSLQRGRVANTRNAESKTTNAETSARETPYLEQVVVEGLPSAASGARNPERPSPMAET